MEVRYTVYLSHVHTIKHIFVLIDETILQSEKSE